MRVGLGACVCLAGVLSLGTAVAARAQAPQSQRQESSAASDPQIQQGSRGYTAALEGNAPPESPKYGLTRRSDGRWSALIRLSRVGVFDWVFLNPRNPPNFLPSPETWSPQMVTDVKSASAKLPDGNPLKLTGPQIDAAIAQVRRLAGELTALRKPAAGVSINAQAIRNKSVELAQAASPLTALLMPIVDVVFESHAGDNQQLVVKFTALEPADTNDKNLADTRARLIKDVSNPAVQISECKDGDDPHKCTATARVSSDQPVRIPLRFFAEATAKKTTTDAVSFDVAFFQENSTPARSTGYFAVVSADQLTEPGNETKFETAVSGAAEFVPKVDDDAVFTADTPYKYTHKADFNSKGLFTVTSSLGSRAVASVDLQFKKGVFDGAAASNVSSPRYQVDIHSIKPLSLTFGHFEFAAPSNGIAVDENGEGVRFTVKTFSAAMIFNPDAGPRVPSSQDRTDKELLLQLQDLSGINNKHLESINLFAVYGVASYSAKTADDSSSSGDAAPGAVPSVADHQYWTAGAETFFNGVDDHLHGSLSIYANHRAAHNGSAAPTATGLSFDANATAAVFQAGSDTNTVAYFLSGEFAYARTYAGEHQQFGSDTQLLGTFLPAFGASTGLESGMADKTFVSLGYTDRRGSLLYLLPRSFRAPETNIPSKSVSVLWNQYTSMLSGHRGVLGNEFVVSDDVESPAQVTFTASVSYFRPGALIKPVLGNKSGFWTLSAKVKVKI